MSDETNPPQKPDDENNSGLKFLWLFCAFVPSLVAISFMGMKNPPQWFGVFALFLDAACSLLAGVGLLSGMKDQVVRVILGVFLGGVFFVLNVIIVVFVGCSGMGGRIAP